MRAFLFKDGNIAIHSDDIKKLKVGEVFNLTLNGVMYDLVLYSITKREYKYHTYNNYTVLCISHDGVLVTEYNDI